jgi:hypothetical protein
MGVCRRGIVLGRAQPQRFRGEPLAPGFQFGPQPLRLRFPERQGLETILPQTTARSHRRRRFIDDSVAESALASRKKPQHWSAHDWIAGCASLSIDTDWYRPGLPP